jgi:hypothetical protein
MKKKPLHCLALSALTALWLGIPASAQQSVPGQTTKPARDNDTTRQELSQFDQFLDRHPEIAEQLRKNPSLVNDQAFLKNHPALQTYLQDHTGIREEIKENPDAFMHQEARYDRREDNRDSDITHKELSSFDQFLDRHREIAEQLRKNPSLVNDKEFVKNHPALQSYLQDNPEVREQIKENPSNFMQKEARYDRGEAIVDRDSSHLQLSRFDEFLDSHREIAQQLRKDPSLANNQQYLKDHPDLQNYLQDHPEIRHGLQQNPSEFMAREDRYDRTTEARTDDRDANRMDRDDHMNRDRDNHKQFESFGQFLGSHSNVARQLSKDPSLVKNQEYMTNHPELQSYLNEHPDVRQHLMENPQNFINSVQQFNHNNSQAGRTTPTADPKIKQ